MPQKSNRFSRPKHGLNITNSRQKSRFQWQTTPWFSIKL